MVSAVCLFVFSLGVGWGGGVTIFCPSVSYSWVHFHSA